MVNTQVFYDLLKREIEQSQGIYDLDEMLEKIANFLSGGYIDVIMANKLQELAKESHVIVEKEPNVKEMQDQLIKLLVQSL